MSPLRGVPPLARRTHHQVAHQAAPQPYGSEDAGVPRVRTLVIERPQQLLAVSPPEDPRQEEQQQRVERSHASPFFSFGFVRA
jgi:hypothetical protein